MAVAVMALGLLSSGCENTEPGIGVFGNPEKLVVVVIPCADDTLIDAVELRSITAQESVWRIENVAGSTEREFPVGDDAPGFVAIVALHDSPLPAGRYQVRVEASETYEWEAFDLDEVRLDDVLVPRRGRVSMDELENLTSCQ